MGPLNHLFEGGYEKRDTDDARNVAAESSDWLAGAIGRLMQGYGYAPSGFAPPGAPQWINPLPTPQPAPSPPTATAERRSDAPLSDSDRSHWISAGLRSPQPELVPADDNRVEVAFPKSREVSRNARPGRTWRAAFFSGER